jgi:acetyl esterase/lipase
MSRDEEHISKKTVVLRIPGVDDVRVERGVGYQATDAGALTMDIYRPPGRRDVGPTPAVVIVAGYPDPGFEAALGCKFKEMGSSVSWGRLIAASGMAAITYTNRDPAADVHTLLRYVRRHAIELGIDADKLGLWAASGNVPLALSVLMGEGADSVRCAVLCYGYTLDAGGSDAVASAAGAWGFANPCAGKPVADLRRDVPLFVARAGRDELPGLNATLDRFASDALRHNLPLTLVNHPAAPHAFDLLDDSETTREVIRRTLAFMRFHLLGANADAAS